METEISESDVETTEPFMEGKHPRTETYAAEFDTMCKNYESLSVQIAADIFKEDSGEAIYEQIQNDYCLLLEAVKDMEPELTVYVVEQTIAGKPQVIGKELFCSEDDIRSGVYRIYLVKSCLGLHSMWQCIGLSDALFLSEEEKNQIDTDKLREYYSDSENKNTMTLFPSYFVEEFADEEARTMAEDAACLLTQYILENYGVEEYIFKGEDVVYRNEWLKSIGVTETLPWNNEDMKNISDIDFSSTVNDSLILTIGIWNFCMEPTDWLVTADDAYLFVKDVMDGYALLLDEFEEYGIDQMEMIVEAQKTAKTIHLKNSTAKSSQTRGNVIFLNDASSVWHEMVHALMPELLTTKNYWISEGMAEFLSRPVVEQSSINGMEWKKMIYRYLTCNLEESTGWTEDMRIFLMWVQEEYQKQKALPEDAIDVDSILFYQTFAKLKVLNHEKETGWGIADNSLEEHFRRNGEKAPEKNGNALSYAEAYLFVGYLVEKYDMESVITLGVERAEFEEIFKSSYEDEYREWKASLAY